MSFAGRAAFVELSLQNLVDSLALVSVVTFAGICVILVGCALFVLVAYLAWVTGARGARHALHSRGRAIPAQPGVPGRAARATLPRPSAPP